MLESVSIINKQKLKLYNLSTSVIFKNKIKILESLVLVQYFTKGKKNQRYNKINKLALITIVIIYLYALHVTEKPQVWRDEMCEI